MGRRLYMLEAGPLDYRSGLIEGRAAQHRQSNQSI